MVEEVNVTRLAAAHAALDADRRGWRGDILVSAIVEVLSAVDRLRSSDLTRMVNRLWGTEAVTRQLVENSLTVARGAYLVREDGEGYWRATDAASREARADRDWAETILRRAESQFGERLVEACESEINEQRLPKLFQEFLVSLTAGAEGIYEAAADSGAPERLRPIQFEMSRIIEYVRGRIRPKSVARAMIELAAAAADPDDAFADDIVRLIMVGNILHGLLTRRDVPERPSLAGTRAVIDTSVLVYLVDEDSSAHEVFRNLCEQSRKADVQLVVADHTLEEWERLWGAADEEIGESDTALGVRPTS